MARNTPRQKRKPPARNYLPWVSHLITFAVGALTGIVVSMMLGDNRSTAASGETQSGTASLSSRVQQIEAHLSHEPGDVDARIQLGNAYFDLGNYQSAIIQYAQALEARPGNPDLIVDMGISYRRIGESETCIRKFREALAIDPRHINARFNLGLVLKSDIKDYPGAIAAWDTLLVYKPDHPQALWIREQIAIMEGN